MTRIVRELAGCGIALAFLTGCPPHQVVIPDRRFPHRIAAEVEVMILVRTADGSLVKQRVLASEGWYLASPEVVGP